MSSIKHRISIKYSRGMTLIEIMVAMVVLSIGLLGLAHLQLFGLDSTDNSYRRGIATYIANDLADRMRANRPVALSGTYDGLDSNSYFTTDPASPSGLPADPACTGSACTPTQMATVDQREWLNNFVKVAGLYIEKKNGGAGWLPVLDGGRGRVLRTGNRFEIEISWENTEVGWDATKKERTPVATTPTFALEFDL